MKNNIFLLIFYSIRLFNKKYKNYYKSLTIGNIFNIFQIIILNKKII